MRLQKALSLLSLLLLATPAQANSGPASFTYEGRMYDAAGTTPLLDTSVVFNLRILNPAKDCIIREEIHTINTSTSDGYFNLNIGTGSTGPSDVGHTSHAVFSNAVPLTGKSATDGSTACTYTPTAGDKRYIRVTTTPSSTGVAVVMTPEIPVTSAPFAMVADTLQGKTPANFVQTSANVTQAKVDRVFNTDYSTLDALLLGTSTHYLKATPTAAVSYNNQRVTLVADPTAAQDAATKNYVDTKIGGNAATIGVLSPADSGKVLQWSGTQWVASVAAATDATKLPLTGGSLTGTLNLPTNGLIAGTQQLVLVGGKVGIGTNAPSGMLHAKDSSTGLPLVLEGASGFVEVKMRTSGLDRASFSTTSSGDFSIDAGANASDDILIQASGNVGIGTSTPGARLDVKGAIRMSGATTGFTGFQPAAAAGSTIWTLPTSDGTANQVLKTDGAGTLGWVTPSGGLTIGQAAGTAMGADAVPNCTTTQKLQMSMGPTFAWSCVTDDTNDATKVAKSGDTMTGALNLPVDGLVAGTNQFVLNAGKVGIGTSTPLEQLHLLGNFGVPVTALIESTGSTTSALKLQTPGSAYSLIAHSSAGVNRFDIYDAQSANARMTVSNAGNVGIGTTSPATILQLGAGAVSREISVARNSVAASPGTHLGLLAGAPQFGDFDQNGGDLNLSAGDSTGTGSSNIYFMTSFGTSSGTANNPSMPRMAIVGNGNVGIGTTSPATQVHIDNSTNATLRLSSASGTKSIELATSAGTVESSISQLGGSLVFNSASGPMRFLAGGPERMTIDNASGKVGIGISNPTYNLHVIGNAGLSTGTAWTNASDARLKDIHGAYEYGLNEVLKLKTVRYNYKKGNALGLPSKHAMTGFIAQEVQKVIPDAVNRRDDGYLELNVDPIHWATVNAVQELHGMCQVTDLKVQKHDLEIVELKHALDTVKAENAALKEAICEINPNAKVCSGN